MNDSRIQFHNIGSICINQSKFSQSDVHSILKQENCFIKYIHVSTFRTHISLSKYRDRKSELYQNSAGTSVRIRCTNMPQHIWYFDQLFILMLFSLCNALLVRIFGQVITTKRHKHEVIRKTNIETIHFYDLLIYINISDEWGNRFVCSSFNITRYLRLECFLLYPF